MIFCDVEKAFDTCSWDYLTQATQELGFSGQMQDWFEMLYNKYQPPTRRLCINGERGPSFTLNSGVPQGDPLSPLAFLFITEAFTRLIEEDELLQGIEIGGFMHLISQFADDTVMYLSGFAQLPRMWELIGIWEQATGMRLNRTKTEGLAVGGLKGLTYSGPGSEGIKWVKPGDYVVSLGIPIGVNFDSREFFRAKYFKCKSLLSSWLSLGHVTPFGRATPGSAAATPGGRPC